MKGSDEDYRFVYNGNDSVLRDMTIIGVLVIIVMTGMIVIHKSGSEKEKKTEIQMEVNAAVAQYFALRGDEPKSKESEYEK